MTVRLQPLTKARLASLGDRGTEWAAALPGLLTALECDWGLRLGDSLPGGSNSYVLRATTAGGAPAVLKVALDDTGLADQVRVLEAADGRGYARLLRCDLDRQALLLEELGAPLDSSGLPARQQLEVLADALAIAWQPARQSRIRAEQDKALGLADLISDHWERLGGPCSIEVRDQALRYAAELADPPADSLVIVHGDPHPGNALAAPGSGVGAGSGYRFVDPDGFVADRAYDLGVTIRDFSPAVLREGRPLVESYACLLADRTGVPAERIWQWAFVERVSTGLYVLGFDAEQVARRYLDSAELLLDAS